MIKLGRISYVNMAPVFYRVDADVEEVLGVPTELVIYPDQFHGLKKPSYIIDRYKRYLDWYAKWIRPH